MILRTCTKLIYLIFLFKLQQVSSKHLECQFKKNSEAYSCQIFNIYHRTVNESLEIIWTNTSDAYKLNTSSVGIYESTVFYIPNEIFEEFPKLETLTIRGVSLKEIQENSFEGAAHLKIFRAELNSLRQLKNSTFNKAKRLEAISLRGNYIDSIEENTFVGLNFLKKLSLGQNSIKKLAANVFAGCPNLEAIFLNNNQIKNFDLGIFKITSNLEWIFLEQNKIERIDGSAVNLKNLKIVNLMDNICINKYFESKSGVAEQLEKSTKSCKKTLQDTYSSCKAKKQQVEQLLQIERDQCKQQVSRINFLRQILSDQLKRLTRRVDDCEDDYEILGFLSG